MSPYCIVSSGKDTENEIKLRREADEENGYCSSKSRRMENRSTATTLTADPESY